MKIIRMAAVLKVCLSCSCVAWATVITAGMDNSGDHSSPQLNQSSVQMLEFYTSTESVVSSMNYSWQLMVEQMVVNYTLLSTQLESLKAEVNSLRSEVWGLKESREKTKTSTTSKPQTPQTYLGSLPEPAEGKSFVGLTTEQIARATATTEALVIQIVNYLDVNLTNPQLFLHRGLERKRAPKTVQAKTREIFTFEKNYESPSGVMLYRIGDSGLSLHLFFLRGQSKFGAGLIENSSSVRTFWPAWKGCSKNTQTPTSMRCIFRDYSIRKGWDSQTTFTIQQGTLFAKLTADLRQKTNILKVEIFNFML